LLDASRSDLQAYLHSRGHAWVDDESNEDLDNPRNRIRHSVLPELNRVYPSATHAIARAAGVAREDSDWLDEVSRARYDALVVEG
jgi:tRNA(Ile)-lysidine synthase TilS/MesJ